MNDSKRNLLLDAALAFGPREFREEYRRQFYGDVASNPSITEFLDVAWSGIALRLEGLRRNLALAVRTLVQAPLFAFITIATLAIAMSVNVAVFSIANAALFAPLPFAHADRLVFLTGHVAGSPIAYTVGKSDIPYYRNGSTTLDDIAAYDSLPATLTGLGVPRVVQADNTSWNFFEITGAHAQLGRLFTQDDERPGTSSIVISDRFWRTTLNADPSVIGRTLTLDGHPARIVGVAQPEFQSPDLRNQLAAVDRFDIWKCLPASAFLSKSSGSAYATARLRPGVSVAAAQADLDRISAGLAARLPDHQFSVNVRSLQDRFLGYARSLILAVSAAVGLVLLIACANVVNLLLVRAAARRKEFALRNALGASRSHIISQVMTELAVLTTAAGAIALLLAAGELRALLVLQPDMLPRLTHVGIDLASVGFILAIVIVATLIAGFAPALSTWNRNLTGALKAGSRSGESAASKRFRSALGVSEVALAFTVLAGCALLVRSLSALTHVDLGYTPTGVYSASLLLFSDRYNDTANIRTFAQSTLAQVRLIPGVDDAALSFSVPGTNGANSGLIPFTQIGAPADPNQKAAFDSISDGYFHVMGIPLVAGRAFTAQDRAGSQPVIVVSAAVAQLLGGPAAIGKRIVVQFGGPNSIARTIVGIVGDIHRSPDSPVQPMFYLPLDQLPEPAFQIVLHASHAPAALAQQVGSAVATADRMQAVETFTSLNEDVAKLLTPQRTSATLMAVLAAVALLLALAGIYAILSYAVEQRRHEFGIRMAIGARSRDVLGNVLGGAVRLGLFGVALGLALAALGTQLISGLLFNVSALDPITLVAVIIILLASVTLASLIPALRGSRLQPAVALRYE